MKREAAVRKYKSRKMMERRIQEMLAQGWRVEETTSHRPMWSAWGTEVYTVTFSKEDSRE
jgi:hypothetical protein